MKCKQQGQMLMDSMDNCFWTAKSKTGIGPGPDNALDIPMGLVHVGGSGPGGCTQKLNERKAPCFGTNQCRNDDRSLRRFSSDPRGGEQLVRRRRPPQHTHRSVVSEPPSQVCGKGHGRASTWRKVPYSNGQVACAFDIGVASCNKIVEDWNVTKASKGSWYD